MKKGSKGRAGGVEEMKPEYDFSGGVRGKHAARFKDVVLVTLDRDVAAVFPDANSVNRVLRGLIKLMSPVAARSTRAPRPGKKG